MTKIAETLAAVYIYIYIVSSKKLCKEVEQ